MVKKVEKTVNVNCERPLGDIASWALGHFRCKNGLFLMAVTEGKSATTPLNSLNPNKAQLDL